MKPIRLTKAAFHKLPMHSVFFLERHDKSPVTCIKVSDTKATMVWENMTIALNPDAKVILAVIHSEYNDDDET